MFIVGFWVFDEEFVLFTLKSVSRNHGTPQSMFPDMIQNIPPGLAILLSHFPCETQPDVCLHH